MEPITGDSRGHPFGDAARMARQRIREEHQCTACDSRRETKNAGSRAPKIPLAPGSLDPGDESRAQANRASHADAPPPSEIGLRHDIRKDSR